MSITLQTNQPEQPDHTISGSWRAAVRDFALGTYVTGGIAIDPALIGLSRIDGVQIIGVKNTTSSPYVFSWDYDDGKLIVSYAPGFTPAGTVAAPTFTGGAASLTATSSKPTFTVESSGAIGTNMEVGLSADTAGATFEGGTGITAQRTLTTTSPVGTPTITPGAYTPTGTNSAPAFTGTAVAAAALAQVGNGVSLASVIVRAIFYGV